MTEPLQIVPEAEAEAEQIWEGNEALRPFLVPIVELVAMEDNPREHNIPMIQESFRRFGQVLPITVQADGRSLVSGHGRTEAVLGLGWTHIAAIPMDFNSEEAARLFSLLDNVTSDAGNTRYDLVQMSLFSGDDGVPLPEFEEFTRARGDAVKETEFEEFGGSGFEDPEGTAARAQKLAQSMRMIEVPILFTQEEHEALGVRIRRLMGLYGTSGLKATLTEAVEREYQRLEAGE